MGLNMSHYLFLEGANKQFQIPEYNPIYRLSYYEQSYVLDTFNSCVEELNNSKLEFVNIINSGEILTEGERLDKIVQTAKKIWDAIINTAKRFMTMIINTIINLINKMKKSTNSSSSDRTHNDILLALPKKSDYFAILNTALNEQEYKISIPNITPTDYLVDPNCPTSKISAMSDMGTLVNSFKSMVDNVPRMDREFIDMNLGMTGVLKDNFVEKLTDNAAKELFGDFYKDFKGQDRLMNVVRSISNKAFGDDSVIEQRITIGLYEQAKDNTRYSSKIIENLTKTKRDVSDSYHSLINSITEISKITSTLLSGPTYKFGPYKEQSEHMKQLLQYVNTCSDILQDIMYAHATMFVYKIKRLSQLYGEYNYSNTILNTCDNIVLQYIKKNESYYSYDSLTYSQFLLDESVLSSKDRKELPDSDFGLPKQRRYPMPDKSHVLSAIRMFNHVEKEYEAELAKNIIKKIKQFDMASEVKVGKNNRFLPYWEKSGLSKSSVKEDYIAVKIDHTENTIMNEILEEMNYNITISDQILYEMQFSNIIRNILEADNNQQQQQNTVTNNQTSSGNGPLKTIGNAIQRIIQALSNTFTKFTDRLNNLVTLNAAWWKMNKNKVERLDISKVKVNDWYDYDTRLLAKSFVLEFDINQPYLATDQAMQTAIFQKIGGTVSVAEDSSFTEKVKSLFRTNYINLENSDGVPFNGTKTTKETMTKYIDDFQKGFNGGTLKTLRDDINKINAAQKQLQRQYNDAVKAAQSGQTTTTQQTQQTTAVTTAQQTGSNNQNQTQAQNADFKFDLSGELGLMENKPLKNIFEAKFTVNDELKQQIGATGGDASKEIEQKINRWFKFMSQAAGAKMTEAISAYNQYIQLYKVILGSPKNNKDNNNQRNQNQQQNQNNQQAQQQQNNQNQQN